MLVKFFTRVVFSKFKFSFFVKHRVRQQFICTAATNFPDSRSVPHVVVCNKVLGRNGFTINPNVDRILTPDLWPLTL
jgi:hypothetical protein